MDPNSTQFSRTPSVEPAQPPKDFKTQLSETSGEFVKDHYEGFLHKLVGIIYSILKLLKNNLVIMIKMATGRD